MPQLSYYHEAVEVVAEVIEQATEDPENLDHVYETLDDVEQQVRGWMRSDDEILPMIHLVQSVRTLVDEFQGASYTARKSG